MSEAALLTGQVPEVPQLVMPVAAELVATSILGMFSVLAIVAAAVMSVRNRTPMYLLVLAGGTLAVVNEPIVDVLGACIHPQTGGLTVFTTFDRPIPLWGVLGYLLFFGATPVLVYLAVRRAADPRRLFLRIIPAFFVVNACIEIPLLNSHIYQYYGTQPFKFFGGFPVHWLFINGVGAAITAVLLYRFAHVFRGARSAWQVLVPTASQLAAVGVAVPAFTMINTDADDIWKWAGSAVTMILGAAALYLLSRALPSGVDPSSVAPEPVRAASGLVAR